MDKLEKLQGARADAVSKMTALHAKAVDENRDFTEDEQSQWEALDAEEKRISKQIEQEKRLSSLNADLEKPEREIKPPDEMVSKVEVGENRAAKKPWENFGEFLIATYRAKQATEGIPGGYIDERFKEARAATGASEGVPSAGGFLVDTEFDREIFQVMHSGGEVLSRVTKRTISAPKLVIKAVDETSRATGSRYGGIQTYWANEADTVTSSKPKFREMELNLDKLFGLFYATDELLRDTVALSSFANDAFSNEIRFAIEDRIINGTGVGQPLGILNAACTVEVSAETSQTAATIVSENILKMWARLHSGSRSNAVWLVEQSIEPQLYSMDLAVGTGGSLTFMPAGGLSQSPYSTLMGRPVVPIEYAQALGTAGDIILADLSQIIYVDQGGVRSDSSIHVRFINDEVVFRYLTRLSAQPLWSSALTPFSGGDSLSPFITLATRS